MQTYKMIFLTRQQQLFKRRKTLAGQSRTGQYYARLSCALNAQRYANWEAAGSTARSADIRFVSLLALILSLAF